MTAEPLSLSTAAPSIAAAGTLATSSTIATSGTIAAAGTIAASVVIGSPAAKRLGVDLTDAEWQKSSRSGPATENCVEVAFVDGVIAVRDSKNPKGPVLIFTPSEWDAFVDGAKDGEFDV